MTIVLSHMWAALASKGRIIET